MVQSGVPVVPRKGTEGGGGTSSAGSRDVVVGAGTEEGERERSVGGVGRVSKGVESVGTLLEECLRLGGRGMGSPMESCLLGSSVGGSAGGVVRETFRSYFMVAVGLVGGFVCEEWIWKF